VAPAQSQCDSTQLPTRFAEAASSARERATKGELPSIEIAVAQNGRIVCEEAFGWADREKRIPATPNTVYAAGSIAKVPAICRTRTWMKRSTMPCVPGITVSAIYTPGVGPYGHSYWQTYWGQIYLSQLADETGGDAYYIGFTAPPVSFTPFLDDVGNRSNGRCETRVRIDRQGHLTNHVRRQRKRSVDRGDHSGATGVGQTGPSCRRRVCILQRFAECIGRG
jgi:Beta-lactamase